MKSLSKGTLGTEVVPAWQWLLVQAIRAGFMAEMVLS